MRTAAAGVVCLVFLASGCDNDDQMVSMDASATAAAPVTLPPLPAEGIEVLDESDLQPQATISDPYGHLFDSNNIRTIRGPVLGIRRFTPRDQTTQEERVFLVLEVGSSGEVIDVILAPEDYLDQIGASLTMTEQIVATGARTVRNTRDTMIASTVGDNDGRYNLRDSAGRPLWR